EIFVCGHSHICRVQYDQKYQMLYINPGAAGKYGLHQKITLLRFIIDGNDMRDMEILELDKH
ncbi:MAG: YfcE family phosphodiesterase, partial [Bacteroidales bacterium]|nr:YfcE family phosphodiesterase [Bacteroidales bacterium]